jgi:hypothetical protein
MTTLPNFTFPSVEYGPRDVPWNMNVLLYKGGASCHARIVQEKISEGAFGRPLQSRAPLVEEFHGLIRDDLADGAARDSALRKIRDLRYFYAYADEQGLEVSKTSVVQSYLLWASSLHAKTRQATSPKNNGEKLGRRTAYEYVVTVGGLIDKVFERVSPIVDLTPLRYRRGRNSAIGIQAEKQNLLDTERFGHAIREICDSLTFEFIKEQTYPIRLKLETGEEIVWYGSPINSRAVLQSGALPPERFGLINFRIEAEFLVFIAQTGMNKTQALRLKLCRFSYYSFEGGYKVREYKRRKHGGVEFVIFRHYRAYFEKYLQWRARIFPDSTDLFPFVSLPGTRVQSRFNNCRIKSKLKEVGIPYIPPQTVRGTRVNWLLRKTGDPNITSQMAQHAQRTWREQYHRPSLQRTAGQVGHYWLKVDPALATESVAPGACEGRPNAIPNIPPAVAKPDCRTGSGCLWCESLRHVDTLDHVWGLCTFRHLKRLELSRTSLQAEDAGDVPSQLAIERIDEILAEIRESNSDRNEWVKEGELRVLEGTYHPSFKAKIQELEGGYD